MGHKNQNAEPIARDGYWYLVRRVPRVFRALDPRHKVTLSTGIRVCDDPRAVKARIRVAELDDSLQVFWQGLREPVSRVRLRAARTSAKSFAATPSLRIDHETLLTMSHPEIWDRFMAVTKGLQVPGTADPRQILSTLHTCFGPPQNAVAPSRIMVSGLLAEFERINATSLAQKSPQQLRTWRVRRQSALDLFVTTVGGDLDAQALTKQHTDLFRSYWQKQALDGKVKINSANRQMRQVAGLYRAVASYHQWEVKNPFAAIRIPGGRDGKRLAFAPSFVQQQILQDGMFETLNPEARRIIYLIAETGVRVIEACALTRKQIHLNGPIPYIEVTNDTHETKTMSSVRQIPLVGVALMAMRAQPDGFPQYYDKPNQLSALVNKALTARHLRPNGQTLYSLRHTLIDRLKAAEAPKDIQEDVVGHTHMYGEGTTLEHRFAWLSKIAFTPPSSV